MNHTQVTTVYGVKCNFLQMLQIESAIPWTGKMTCEETNHTPLTLCLRASISKTVNLFSTSSKKIYEVIGENTLQNSFLTIEVDRDRSMHDYRT